MGSSRSRQELGADKIMWLDVECLFGDDKSLPSVGLLFALEKIVGIYMLAKLATEIVE